MNNKQCIAIICISIIFTSYAMGSELTQSCSGKIEMLKKKIKEMRVLHRTWEVPHVYRPVEILDDFNKKIHDEIKINDPKAQRESEKINNQEFNDNIEEWQAREIVPFLVRVQFSKNNLASLEAELYKTMYETSQQEVNKLKYDRSMQEISKLKAALPQETHAPESSVSPFELVDPNKQ